MTEFSSPDQSKPNVALVGLGVMGSNLARNIESRGYHVAVHNRRTAVTDDFMSKYADKKFVPVYSIEELVKKTQAPRQIILMVTAGKPVDDVLDSLIPVLSKGDIIVDGGNTYYTDTRRREKRCAEAGLNFLGVGISGGEEGALYGPSLMPGGPQKAYEIMAPLLKKIAAVADGQPCTTYIGPEGAGHFVKMVHNGIEYGDMQLIAEAYDLLKGVLGASPLELSSIFDEWNQGVLQSFLIEITSKIFKKRDADGERFLVDQVLDRAGQKGTGKWTAQVALDLGVAIPTLSAAVDARILSSIKNERESASTHFASPVVPSVSHGSFVTDRKAFIKAVHDALYCSKIMAYAQGRALLAAASREWNWDLKLDQIASIWKGGCIIRAQFLEQIRKAYGANGALSNLILDPTIRREVTGSIENLRRVVGTGAERGIPTIAFSASLAYFDSYRSAHLPQNLTQAQRDFFGAHTYERVDNPGVFVHSSWE